MLFNGSASEWTCNDPRVRVLRASEDVRGIGALKRLACDAAHGDILVELDHDDLLAPECLARIADAFERHPEIGFVYSSRSRFRDDGGHPGAYDAAHGWLDPEPQALGWAEPAWPPTPQALARIWYAPDHVRAWRRETYYAAGSHDPAEAICDDYSLLLRTYLITDFHLIQEPLYYYREGGTSSGAQNAEIQRLQFELGDAYRVRIAETWAKRRGLALIDLCSNGNAPEGYIGLDLRDGIDLDRQWPYGDNEVGVIRAQDALEHLTYPAWPMREGHRVLVHGGWFFADTPSTDGRGADMDPGHVSRWNENSFWYWTREASQRYLPGWSEGQRYRFQCWDLQTLFYDEWHRRHNISYVRAHLSAIKDGPRLPGLYDLDPRYCG